MKAVVISQFGGPDVLKVRDYPTPEPGPEEVLIEVKASGLNRADTFQRQGHYPAPPGVPADIPGMEAAGVVVRCGPGVTQWKIGDRVCALVAGGAYAQYLNVREGQCLPAPLNFSFVEAASLPETVSTVWSNVFQRGSLKTGENLLVHGGNSGIGITAIQLGKAFDVNVFVTVGTEEKGKICLSLGADRFVNYKTQDFALEYSEVGMDVILDMVGGEYLAKNMNILRPDGRLVYINAVAGNLVNLNITQMMIKRLYLTGSTLRGRDYAFRKALAAEIYKRVWPLMESGRFKPVIYKTFPYTEAAAAHHLMESNSHTGKIMLTWD